RRGAGRRDRERRPPHPVGPLLLGAALIRKIVLFHPEVMADLVQDRPPHLLHQLPITPARLLMCVIVERDALRQILTCPARTSSLIQSHHASASPLVDVDQ